MDTNISKLSKTAKAIIGVMAVLIAILFFLVLRTPSAQSNNLLGDKISIRQDAGKVQWQFAGSDDWQTITTVSDLTGQKGDTGAKGEQGEKGEDGASGKDGTQGAQGEQGVAGQDGQDGTDGIAGINGADGADGTDGREIELQKDLLYIQWRYVGDPTWTNLIAYSDLKRDKGDKGDKGDIGATGPANTLSIGTVTKPSDCTPTASITGTAPNQVLNLGIPGLPNGGATGQVLTKNSGADCDAVWANTNVIVGAGRPDVSASMDAGTQAKVASATSGTEFRSTNGPQGAWVWMKQGGSWRVTKGDTGVRNIASLLENGWQVGVGGEVAIRRINTTVIMKISLRNDTATATTALSIPFGFRLSGTTNATFMTATDFFTTPYFAGGIPLIMAGMVSPPAYYSVTLFNNTYYTEQSWPSSLPGVAV